MNISKELYDLILRTSYSSITGATNGLTKYGKNIGFGGLLNNTTNIDLDEYELNFIGDTFITFQNGGVNGSVRGINIQPDKKILLTGYFTTYSGVTKNHIVRLNIDGTIDSTFNMGTGFVGNYGASIVLQQDNKIIVGGNFSSYNGTTSNNIIRLNPDGTIDNSFVIGTGFNSSTWVIKLLNDNKILVAGNFTQYNGDTANYLIRLNSNGSVDSSFNIGSGFGIASGSASSMAVQEDGKIILVGTFTTYSGVSKNYIVRIESDGSIDNTFNVGSGFNTYAYFVEIQNDGKIIVVGDFTSYNGISSNRIIRLNNDGSVDTTFNVGVGFNSYANSIAIQNDGKILIGGNFSSYNGVTQNQIVRLDVDGNIDVGFNSGSGLNGFARVLYTQPNGKIFMGGEFTTYNGITANYIVKLNYDGTINFNDDFIVKFDGKTVKYDDDYSFYYTNRSLVDKEYVDNLISGGTGSTNITVSNGLTKIGDNIVLGGTLTGNTCIGGNYTLTFTGSSKINSTSGYQVSGVTIFDTGNADINSLQIGCGAIAKGTSNISIGRYAGLYSCNGAHNVFLGTCAGYCATGGTYNIAIGTYSLQSNTTGSYNISNGCASLYNNTCGSYNIANGYQILFHNTSGCFNIANGSQALYNNTTGCYNIANGFQTLISNTNGSYNIGNGYVTLYKNTTGSFNIANGYAALYCNTTGNNNIAVGTEVLYCNNIGCYNIALGNQAMRYATGGTNNIAFGSCSLYSNRTGYENIAIGCESLNSNTTGFDNIGIGPSVLTLNTSGGYNIGLGYYTLFYNSNGSCNLALSPYSLHNNTSGCANISLGYDAMYYNTSGCFNIGIGQGVLGNNTTGCNNVAVGKNAGYNNITGKTNVFIGHCAGFNETGSNKLYIANSGSSFLIKGCFSDNTICNGSNSTTWNTTSDVRVKENITPICCSINLISKLNPVIFDYTSQYSEKYSWKENQRICNYGFIAQEFECVFPKYVTTSIEKIGDNTYDNFKTINSGHLIPILIKAIQEQQGEIDLLKKRLNNLNG